MNAGARLAKLEALAAVELARRIPPKDPKPLKIYTLNVDLAGRESWEGGKAPKDGDNNLILTFVQTRPDDEKQGP